MNDSIVCYAAQGDTPRELWATNVGFGYEHAPPCKWKRGVMFGSTKEGLIFALEGKQAKYCGNINRKFTHQYRSSVERPRSSIHGNQRGSGTSEN